MIVKKLISIDIKQKESLEEIQGNIEENGTHVSVNQLIRDSIQILLNYHKNEIIEKYSTFYYENGRV